MVKAVPMLYSTNLAELRDFFKVLGFNETGNWLPGGKLRWCSMEYESASIMLQHADKRLMDRSLPDISIYFTCEDVDVLYRRWTAAGVQVSRPKDAFYGERQIFVRDTDGRYLCFEHRVAPSTGDSEQSGAGS